uniref:ORF49 n=1 Tax=Nitrosopumilaceae spindle-shaped virus TaxID=3065433 RepID=A0AAT9J9X8_9VIRU
MLRLCCVPKCGNKFEYNSNQKYCKSCSTKKRYIPCCVPKCGNKFEYNPNQKYCKSCSTKKTKERYTRANKKRGRRVIRFCVVCDKIISDTRKFYCSDGCQCVARFKTRDYLKAKLKKMGIRE